MASESAPSSSSSRSRRRASRRREAPSSTDANLPVEQGSVLWTLLLLGLIFCLVDVAYILSYVDDQRSQQETSHFSLSHLVPEVQHDTLIEDKEAIEEAKLVQGIPHTEEAKEEQEEEPSNEDIFYDKEPLLKIIRDAGITDISNETVRELPTWTQVTTLYGDHPRIYGLDQCAVFQNHSDAAEHFVSTAGPFNSGTNLMAELLIHNCHMSARMKKYGTQNQGVRWQVPWGKHNPPGDEAFRQGHKTKKDANVDANEILPAVTIRDPFVWMQSMCRHQYTAKWETDSKRHCPNLVPNAEDRIEFKHLKDKDSVPVRVRYGDRDEKIFRNHDSLVHFYNDWYQEYIEVDFPRIIVRFEDLVFFAKETTKAVCECAGGNLNKRFRYIVDSAKKGEAAHGPMSQRTGFVDSIIRYGTDKGRFKGFEQEDLEFSRKHLNRDLMDFFGYPDPPAEY